MVPWCVAHDPPVCALPPDPVPSPPATLLRFPAQQQQLPRPRANLPSFGLTSVSHTSGSQHSSGRRAESSAISSRCSPPPSLDASEDRAPLHGCSCENCVVPLLGAGPAAGRWQAAAHIGHPCTERGPSPLAHCGNLQPSPKQAFEGPCGPVRQRPRGTDREQTITVCIVLIVDTHIYSKLADSTMYKARPQREGKNKEQINRKDKDKARAKTSVRHARPETR
ncbi:hypothetical protein C2E23DRAFT_580189 [Lenzites betulinus]|nr:hypothetical protein C2E23DRAFT_580189 [Lenzites betulinus]